MASNAETFRSSDAAIAGGTKEGAFFVVSSLLLVLSQPAKTKGAVASTIVLIARLRASLREDSRTLRKVSLFMGGLPRRSKDSVPIYRDDKIESPETIRDSFDELQSIFFEDLRVIHRWKPIDGDTAVEG